MSHFQDNRVELSHPIVEDLFLGNKRWISSMETQQRRDFVDTGLDYINSQSPKAVIITCADSRVIPEFIFDTGVGELFVIRVAGNVITEEVAASVEFAVLELKVEVVLVLGHQNCGAIIAKIQHETNGKDLSKLNLQKLYERLRIVSDTELNEPERINASIEANISFQNQELLKISELCEEFVKNNTLIVLPAIYQLDTREVEIL